MEKYKPKIILSAAISIDGKLASNSGDSSLSSKKDLIRLHKLRTKVDSILVGKNTVVKDDPSLTVRYCKGKNPTRIILDSKGELSNQSRVLQTSNKVKTVIAVSKKINEKNFKRLKKFPVEIIVVGKNQVDILSLLKKLCKMNIRSILLEGGGTINWEFIRKNLVDEFFITVTPFILGGKNSVSLIQGQGFDKITKSPKLRLKSVKKLENDLVLHYMKL